MMDFDRAEHETCEKFRFLYDVTRDQDERSPDLDAVNLHFAGCAHCRRWREQTDKLLYLARGLPQFDVPEAATQKILAAVKSERRYPVLVETFVLVPMSLIIFAATLVAIPVDSVDGACSWIVGALIVSGLGFIRKGAMNERAALR